VVRGPHSLVPLGGGACEIVLKESLHVIRWSKSTCILMTDKEHYRREAAMILAARLDNPQPPPTALPNTPPPPPPPNPLPGLNVTSKKNTNRCRYLLGLVLRWGGGGGRHNRGGNAKWGKMRTSFLPGENKKEVYTGKALEPGDHAWGGPKDSRLQ